MFYVILCASDLLESETNWYIYFCWDKTAIKELVSGQFWVDLDLSSLDSF